MSYGIPYQGSKQSIAKYICGIFPKSENFYDLFGGGFSISHFMIKNRYKDFKQFHFNEIRQGMTNLIKDAIAGKYSYNNFKPKFIDRKEFFEKLETDLYIKTVWSFGNNGKTYLFSKEIEPYKKSMHNAIVFNEFDEKAKEFFGFEKFNESISIYDRRLLLRNKVIVNTGREDRQLQQLERLQQLQQLERLQQLHFYSGDYREVPIKENSVIYCDIPYNGTGKYDKNKSFNHDEFYTWARGINHPVFISEYNMPKDFRCIWKKQIRTKMSGSSKVTMACEKVFCNQLAFDLIRNKK